MRDDFTKQNLEDCGLSDGPKEPARRKHLRSAVDHLTTAPESCGLSDPPKPEPVPPGRPAGPSESLIKGYDTQAAAYRRLNDPWADSPQVARIRTLTDMIIEQISIERKRLENKQALKKRQGQLDPYGRDVPIDLDGQDLADFYQDKEEAGSNGGPEGDTPNITQQGDRTRSFKPGTQVRTRDRYKVRGIGVVLSSKDGMVLVSWGDGDEETYNAWELIACKPPSGDDDMADTGL